MNKKDRADFEKLNQKIDSLHIILNEVKEKLEWQEIKTEFYRVVTLLSLLLGLLALMLVLGSFYDNILNIPPEYFTELVMCCIFVLAIFLTYMAISKIIKLVKIQIKIWKEGGEDIEV